MGTSTPCSSASATRGTSSTALPARSTPAGIQTIPRRGAPGAVALGVLTTAALSPALPSVPRDFPHAASSSTTAAAETVAPLISVVIVAAPLAQPHLLQ